MRLTQIQGFLAAAESGSIRAAARRLGVSQPAMTKSVHQLEEELQVRLFHRTTRGVVVTRTGKVFLARARVIQAELRRAGEDLAELRGERGGAVAVGVSPMTSAVLIPGAIVHLRQQRPLCSVHVVEGVWSSLQPAVRDGQLDLAIVLKTPDAKLDPAIRFKPLYRAHMVVAGRCGHPMSHARSLRDLASASWLMFGPPGPTALLSRHFAVAGLPPPAISIQCESSAAALALLMGTDTIGLVEHQFLVSSYTGGFLQQLNVDEPSPEVTVGILSRSDEPLSPSAKAMVRAAATAAQRLISSQAGARRLTGC
ncbi:MAG TPA: LysR substrate-binding domain-containing protein [Burkholderiales bacterium]